ncbi:26S protease regulatory subunit 7 [Artemisia annua]|uniref:26S protease regulatory subunit 7 n=1 Tax=Artemisia annua TaxID=35608 RepID=A0A2U1MT88_ARTAN|nr:26S protease regulatory subunit 7 [Artemisia annua]
MKQEEQPLQQVDRGTKINPNTEDATYIINVKQIAKFLVGLGDKVSPSDIEEGMCVGVDRTKYQIQIPLPPKIDPSVTMMTVEEKPHVTNNDVGGCKEQIEKMREVVELPMLHPEKFIQLGINPTKGVLCYGPPGTGKTLLAKVVANMTDDAVESAPDRWRLVRAHGTAVGLPTDDDMGNSEVGHNALGAGRIYAQGTEM